LVVLTNKYSASASEILAGAIKDHRRGLLVGDSTTLGKGTVQSVIDLKESFFGGGGNDMGAGKITIRGFYRPSGISTQRIGVDADIVLPSLTDVADNISEAELDNVLTFKKVEAAGFAPRPYVRPDIVTELRQRSAERVKSNEDFAKEQDRILAYKEILNRRATLLNEKKYLEESRRFNTDEWEREEMEDLLGGDKKIKRNFYIDEALAITVDYVKAAQESGVAFPKERAIQAPPPRRNFLGFGL
jgi:carboxyl-terminal processing protease